MAVGLQEQWFVATESGGQGGPYSAAQLAQLLEQGVVAWTSQVWRDGLKDWRPARRDDVLVMAVASARGMSIDTRRIESLGSWMQADDTVSDLTVEERARDTLAVDEGGDTTAHSALPPPFHVPASGETRLPPPVAPSITAGPAEEPPRAVPSSESAPVPSRRLAHLSTPLIAVFAFTAGALFTSVSGGTGGPAGGVLTGSIVALGSALGIAASPSEASPGATSGPEAPPPLAPATPATVGELGPALAPAAALRPPEVENVEIVKRSLPAVGEVRAELARLGAAVRRCVRRAGRVDVELAIEGETGHVRDVEVRTPVLRRERAACVARVLHVLEVAPFVSARFRLRHRYDF